MIEIHGLVVLGLLVALLWAMLRLVAQIGEINALQAELDDVRESHRITSEHVASVYVDGLRQSLRLHTPEN